MTLYQPIYRKVNRNKIFLAFAIFMPVLLCKCVNTEGELKIEGRTIDEYSKTVVPRRNIIVQALIKNSDTSFIADAGQFSTDSLGRFKYTLKKIKDARFYTFFIAGDSNYAFEADMLGLYELQRNARFLSFPLSKLADLSINIYRKSKKPVADTLSLSWISNGIYYWDLYPYRIYNYDKANNLIPAAGGELRWAGGYVNTVVKTKVFADKKTKLRFDLDRYGNRNEFIDTITCRRDRANFINFIY
jgi:hypothetical protein